MADKKMIIRVAIYVAVAVVAGAGVTAWKNHQAEKRREEIARNEAAEAVLATELLQSVSHSTCGDGCAH
jgi:hypothetical protein